MVYVNAEQAYCKGYFVQCCARYFASENMIWDMTIIFGKFVYLAQPGGGGVIVILI